MATLIRKVHQGNRIQLVLFDNVHVGLSAQGHPANDMPNTHNAQGKIFCEQHAGTPYTRLEAVKPVKTAWEYYNEATEIIDRERERDWLEQMDTILIFVRANGGADLY